MNFLEKYCLFRFEKVNPCHAAKVTSVPGIAITCLHRVAQLLHNNIGHANTLFEYSRPVNSICSFVVFIKNLNNSLLYRSLPSPDKSL